MVIYGAGPVGLMAACSAPIRGRHGGGLRELRPAQERLDQGRPEARQVEVPAHSAIASRWRASFGCFSTTTTDDDWSKARR